MNNVTEKTENKKSVLDMLIIVISVAMTIFQFATAAYRPLASMNQRSIHLIFMLVLFFLYEAQKTEKKALRAVYYLGAVISAVSNLYLTINYIDITRRTSSLLTIDIVVSIVIIVLVMFASWRNVSVWMMAVAGVFLIYAWVGQHIPGILHFSNLTLNRALSNIVISSDGIFGSTISVSATYVFMFVLLGDFLLEYGAGQFIINLAYSVFGRYRGGALKVATFASALFGMVSGSGTANVMGTGTFTIPMIKSRGYAPEFAGASEAAASTGGLLMPPVMGAAAFIMAEYLGIPYGELCALAIIPAFFFFLNLFFVGDLRSIRVGDFGSKPEDLPELKKVLKEGWHHAICIGVLVYFLCIARYSASKSCVYAIITLLVCDYLRRIISKEKINVVDELKRLVHGSVNACKGAITICMSCACAGIIVGVFSSTGLNLRLSGILIQLADGNLLLLLIFAMIGGLILGMGMPSVSVYILLAIMVAPSIINMGVNPIAAHMFLFYFGVLAPITPPVGICFYAAATIAKSNPMKTGFNAWRLALPGFILPFLFVYDERIMGIGSVPGVIWTCIYAGIGLLAMGMAFEGNVWKKQMNVPLRILLGAFSVMTVVPELSSTLIGLAGIIAIIVLTMIKGKPFTYPDKDNKIKEAAAETV